MSLPVSKHCRSRYRHAGLLNNVSPQLFPEIKNIGFDFCSPGDCKTQQRFFHICEKQFQPGRVRSVHTSTHVWGSLRKLYCLRNICQTLTSLLTYAFDVHKHVRSCFMYVMYVSHLSLSAVKMTRRSRRRDANTRRSKRRLRDENKHSKSTCSRRESDGRHNSITWRTWQRETLIIFHL